MHSFYVLIPVYNPPKDLIDAIERIGQYDKELLSNLVVIDDASANGVVDILQEEIPEVRIIRGDGNLWWAGGMCRGMEKAIEEGVDVVVWLNHDCIPDPGTIRGLVDLAAEDGVGAVSAWCYCREDRNFGVNPGFRDFGEVPLGELQRGETFEVDGVNGNCTAISCAAIQEVGLPETAMHPHYGDGPYTWRLHKGGFRNFVAPMYRAALEREFERCVDEADHSSFWQVPLLEKLSYYLLSNRSKHHWRHRFHDLRVFRGNVVGVILYPLVQGRLILKVVRGHMNRTKALEERLGDVVARYAHRYPEDALRRDLKKLDAKYSG